MYKYDSGQLSLSEFGQPVGMRLREDNRWVQKAKTVPWDAIEHRYAALFKNRKGNVAKPLRLALGACLIQAEYGYSDVEVATMIQEHPYLQYFCGYKEYDDSKLPFDPSLMVYFRKRLTPEILGEINEMIIAGRDSSPTASEDDDDDQNKGTMIVDATCAPSQIKYPTDSALLNEARENTEAMIDEMHTVGEKKPRTYRKRARKDYLALARSRKPGAKKIRKAVGKQLNYLRRNLGTIEVMLESGGVLSERGQARLETVQKLYEQQKYMYDKRTHSVPDRIVSLSQPWLRPIVRGKAGAAVEFGAKLDISVVNGWTRMEVFSFDAYNESGGLKEMIQRYRQRTGHYPERILADKVYRNRDNLAYCKGHGIRLSGPAPGRPKKGAPADKKQNYIDECERVEVERRFSLAKRKCGLGLITARLEATACHCIAISILALNLRRIQCALINFFFMFLDFCRLGCLNGNLRFVQ
jgi:IS5 family transposase